MQWPARAGHCELMIEQIDSYDRVSARQGSELHEIEPDAADPEDCDRFTDL